MGIRGWFDGVDARLDVELLLLKIECGNEGSIIENRFLKEVYARLIAG